jgi:hypothetical protein
MARFRLNRRTGLPVAPAVPIFKKDCPYRRANRRQTVLRCMELDHFRQMCLKQALFFSRASNFNDGLEGMPSDLGIHGTSLSDQLWRQVFPFVEDHDQLIEQQRLARSDTFVCCWRMDQFVDSRMWTEYSKSHSSEMVVVSSSVAELEKHLPHEWLRFSPVKYLTSLVPRSQLDSLSLFFYKDKALYGWEQELRIAYNLARQLDEAVTDQNECGQFLRVNSNRLVHRIIPHPQISKCGLLELLRLARHFCPRARIELQPCVRRLELT